MGEPSVLERVADAVTEIELLERWKAHVDEINDSLSKENANLRAKLREYTEADPVLWQVKWKGHYGWDRICYEAEELAQMKPNVEVRALIVKPKEDTKCPTKE